MSATNRGGKRSEADFYATPSWCVRRLVEAVDLPGGIWVDPCAGEGAIIEACPAREDILWAALELRGECRPALERIVGPERVAIVDYLEQEPLTHVDVLFTNPPFSLAEPMITRAVSEAQVAVMLLRLNYLGSAKRAPFLRAHPPDIYVLPNRPSFTGKGTDSIEYAWFVWDKRLGDRTMGRWTVLPCTPKEERQAG